MSLRGTLSTRDIGIFPFCKIFSHGAGNCNVKSSGGNKSPARRAILCNTAVATITGNILSTF